MMRIKPSDYFWLLLAALIYLGLARFGMALFSLKPSNITLLWLPSGVALVMCLQWGYRALPFIMAASFVANYAGMSTNTGANPVLHTAISAMADGMVGIIAMHMFRRFLPNGLSRTHDLLPFGLWVCLLPTTITSTILAANLAAGGYIAWHETSGFIHMLILGDSLGMLLIYQIYQGWLDREPISRSEQRWLGASVLVMLALLAAGFTVLPGMIYFIVPMMLVLSFNAGLIGVATISSATLISIIVATAHNAGPFVAAAPMESHFQLMAFVFSSALTILGIALQNRQLLTTEQSIVMWKDAAEHDPLTGLMNRRAFIPRLQSEHQRALRTGNAYTFAMLDLDHFKRLNDTYGHDFGDLVLRNFAAIMVENCRAIDVVVRMGGEEFGILFPECAADEALVPLERIRTKFEQGGLMVGNHAVSVTVSIGVATLADIHESELQIVTRADNALYAAKSQGRNRIIVDIVT